MVKGTGRAKERKMQEESNQRLDPEMDEEIDEDPYCNQQSTPVFVEKPNILEEVNNKLGGTD